MSVYFIRAGDTEFVKIGYAVDPEKRLADLQCAHYEDLSLLRVIEGGVAVERWLHRHFKKLRVRGEWFCFSSDMLSVVVPSSVGQKGFGPLQRAIDHVGNQSRLADQLGVKPGHVWFWLHRAKKLPPEVAIGIEGVTGGQVRRHELRPDIFDPPEAAA